MTLKKLIQVLQSEMFRDHARNQSDCRIRYRDRLEKNEGVVIHAIGMSGVTEWSTIQG